MALPRLLDRPDETELDEHYCEHCEADTPHMCRYSNHDRDSSGDYLECQVCKWYRIGMDGKYNPPEKE